jgi:hypothetical protein
VAQQLADFSNNKVHTKPKQSFIYYFDVIGFVLGIICITHSCNSQMKKFHVTFLIWIGEVVIGSLEWHGEVTKIGAIKCRSQQ